MVFQVIARMHEARRPHRVRQVRRVHQQIARGDDFDRQGKGVGVGTQPPRGHPKWTHVREQEFLGRARIGCRWGDRLSKAMVVAMDGTERRQLVHDRIKRVA